MFKLEYTKNAVKDLHRLEKQIAIRILKKMDFFSKQEDPLSFAKKLTDSSVGEYRFRVGDYRVLFIRGKPREINYSQSHSRFLVR